MDPFLPDADKVAAIRELLPATGAGIYLDAATAGPISAEIARAGQEADDWDLRVGRGGPDRRPDSEQRLEEARAVVAALLSADPQAIAIVRGVADGLHAATWAPAWSSGDSVVTCAAAGDAVLGALLPLHRRGTAHLQIATFAPSADDDEIVRGFEGAIGARTRLVVLPLVAPETGARLPLARVAELGQRVGAFVCVDATQAAGAFPIDVESSGADFVTFPGHTWLLGPEGAGALWVSQRALADARSGTDGFPGYGPLGSPGAAALQPEAAEPRPEAAQPRRDARRFVSEVPPRTAVLQLARAVGWLAMYVGLPWALQRGMRLARWTAEALAATDGVEVVTPRSRMATIVVFRIRGWTPVEVAEELSKRVFAILGQAPSVDGLRASVGFWNTEAELERFVGAVRELARYTPETLPRRPSLVVLSSAEPPEAPTPS